MRLRDVVAALPLALGACGDDGGDESFDAEPSIDAEEHDAAPPDAIPEGPVTVTVTAQGNPVPGIDVVFNNPDGTVNGVEQTGSGGQASRDLQIGGSATIVVDAGGGAMVGITFAAVEPGDQLAFSFEPPSPMDVGNFSATLPVGVVVGAVSYDVSLGCATTNTTTPAVPVTGDIFSDCLGSDQTIDAFVTALDNMGSPLAYDYVKDVAVVAGGGTTNLTFDAWQMTSVPLAITLNNVPAGVPGAGYEAHWRVDGLDFGGFGGGGGPPTSGTITLNSSYPTGSFVERLQYGIFYQYGNQPSDGLGIIIAGHADAPVAAAHDLGALALPEITTASASASGGRVSLTWDAAGSLASTDGGLVLMSWADAGGPTTDQWFVLIPPDAASPYEMPEMPSDVSTFVPPAPAVFATPTVIFGEGDYIDGYADWRGGDGFIIFGDQAFDGLPATGGVFRATLGGALPGGGG